MTLEEKELLLKDLSGRLPYGVKVKTNNINILKLGTHTRVGEYVTDVIEPCKPYLFPLSSMTEEQTEELIKLINTGQNDNNEFMRSLCRIEFYHKYHFDYRGLIPKGLALDATNLNIY